MTDEEQNIAVAEALGWTGAEEDYTYYGFTQHIPMKRIRWTPPDGSKPTLNLPDYGKDLNAMQEAWDSLSLPLKANFAVNLNKLMGLEENICGWIRLIGATAAQRREAFLLTLGLWKEA